MNEIVKHYPFVGIVLLNWNGWQDTVECLESLRWLEYRNYRIFVVDNASTDDSIIQIRKRFSKVEIICSIRNGGFAEGNNQGIRAALNVGAELIWLLNNDVTVSSLSLTHLVLEAQRDSRIGAIGSIIFEYGRPWQVQAVGGGKYHSLLATTQDYKHDFKKDGYITGASMLIKREVVESVGYLNDKFFFFMEDLEYSLRIRAAGWSLGVASNSWVFHKGGASVGKVSGIKSQLSDRLFANSVGYFMSIKRIPIPFVFIRLLLIIFRRLLRLQFNRILPTVISFLRGYIRGGCDKKSI